MKEKAWMWIVWSLFILLIGVGLGQWWRIKQIEPKLRDAHIEILESNRKIAHDLTDLDVRLTLMEKKVYGTRVKQ